MSAAASGSPKSGEQPERRATGSPSRPERRVRRSRSLRLLRKSAAALLQVVLVLGSPVLLVTKAMI